MRLAAYAVLLALAPAACGGGDDAEGETARIRTATTTPATTALPAPGAGLPEAETVDPAAAAEHARRAGRAGKGEDDPGDDPLDAPPPPDDAGGGPVVDPGVGGGSGDPALQAAVARTLSSLGYRAADVHVSGRTVEAAVRAADACDGPGAGALADEVRERHSRVRMVTVTIAESGRSLAEHQRSRCGANGGGGRVVYSRSGSGPFTTPAFSISGRRWSVSYRSSGDFFEAFALRGGRFEPLVLSATRPGSGSGSFRGPGRFQLKIRAAAGWTVTVRDGA